MFKAQKPKAKSKLPVMKKGKGPLAGKNKKPFQKGAQKVGY